MAADPPTPHNRYRNANCTEPIMGSIWYPMRTRSRPVRTALITEEVVKEKTSGRQTWKSKALADPDANSDDSGVNRAAIAMSRGTTAIATDAGHLTGTGRTGCSLQRSSMNLLWLMTVNHREIRIFRILRRASRCGRLEAVSIPTRLATQASSTLSITTGSTGRSMRPVRTWAISSTTFRDSSSATSPKMV